MSLIALPRAESSRSPEGITRAESFRLKTSMSPGHPKYFLGAPTLHTSTLIPLSNELLEKIEICLRRFRDSFPKKELAGKALELQSFLKEVQLQKETLSQKVKKLEVDESFASLNLESLKKSLPGPSLYASYSQHTHSPILSSFCDISAKSNLTKRKIQHIHQIQPYLDNAEEALKHYSDMLNALKAADDLGYLQKDQITISKHIREINHRIFFLGLRFKKVSKVGEGGYGIAKRCYFDETPYVIKVPKTLKIVQGELFRDNQSKRDILVPLALGDHPNVVKVYAVTKEEGKEVPILEYIKGKDLSIEMQNPKSLIYTPNIALSLLEDAANGLAYMHDQGFVHKDVKSANIFIRKQTEKKEDEEKQTSFSAVIGDFGTSVLVEKANSLSGTNPYMAPEVACIFALQSEKKTPKSRVKKVFVETEITDKADVFSFGHVIFELVSGGRNFFIERNMGSLIAESASISYSEKETFRYELLKETCDKVQKKTKTGIQDPVLKEALLTLAAKCLIKKAEKRPSMKEVVEEIRRLKSLI